MRTFRQLLRQPGRTLCGCLMIGLAVAALILCFGQSIAADRAEQQLQETFRTAALLTEAFQLEIETVELPGETLVDRLGNVTELPGETIQYERLTPLIPDAVSAWVESLPEQHPELVKQVADHGLASAYIPELSPDNYASHAPEVNLMLLDNRLSASRSSGREPMPFGTPYDYAMLEITLTKIGEPVQKGTTDPLTGVFTEEEGIALVLEGRIDRILALQDGYPDCLGFTVHLYLNLPDQQTLDGLDLELGGRYLVYGTGYYDFDWVLRDQIMDYYSERMNREIVLDSFDPENLRLYDQMVLDKYESYGQSVYSVGYYVHEDDIISLDNREYAMFRKVYLELDWAENHGTDTAYTARYAVPNLVRLDGSAEDFLTSENGTLWEETLEYLKVNAHCFPILAVEDIGNIGEFIRGSTRIVEGKAFSPREAEAGERVCVISETVAALSGLTVGDTITLWYYETDPNSPYQCFLEDGVGVTNPAAYRFGRTTPFCKDGETYTIIGLYRYDGAWASVEDNIYSITPNTVFVPESSVPVPLSRAKQGAFRTMLLHNEALRSFIIMAEEAGYGELFLYYDQGYNTIAQSIEEYRIIAGRAMLVGGIIYGVILLLYLILFPAGTKHNLMIMDSLGASRWERIGHMMLSSFGLLLSGTLLGCGLGAALWSHVVQSLTASAEISLDLTLDLWGFVCIAGSQLLLAMGIIWILAYRMTRPRTLAGRK